jgi:uncharacterized membrane protein
MRKWFPALLVLAGYLLSAATYSSMPERVPFDLRGLVPFETSETVDAMSRTVAAFLMPTIALGAWLLLHEAPGGWLGNATTRMVFRNRVDAPPLEYHKFAGSYRLIVVFIVSLLLSMHVALLASALAWNVAPGTIVGIVLGAGLVVIGNLMPRLRPNAVAGIRTARTMRDPLLWARVHRLYGALWLGAGIVVIAVAIAAPRWAFACGVAALLLSSLAMLAALPSLSAESRAK